MATPEKASVDELKAELLGLNARIEAAAVEQDAGQFVAFLMRQATIPALIRESRAVPVRRQIEASKREASAMDEEVQRVREAVERVRSDPEPGTGEGDR